MDGSAFNYSWPSGKVIVAWFVFWVVLLLALGAIMGGLAVHFLVG